ncbi:MAG: branched-chain amino acid ABC transporter permease [Armatimonadota bacterium]|nr:branched-chain amino acid ABC transporter permease [Armatimonadota bacterium]MDW8155268.1 branched-chain amino acid ABC transporter permease [Armatimonadota bacterium]
MTLALQYVANGLAAGSLYALVALGIVLLYRSSRVLNFAHGDLATLGVFLAFTGITRGWRYGLCLAAGLLGAAAVSAGFYRLLIKPARQATSLSLVITTLGFALLLSGLMVWVWGTDTKVFPFPLSETRVHRLGGVVVSELTAGSLAVGLFLVSGLSVLVQKTRLGLAMRAVAQNPEAAQLLGVPAGRVLAATWAVAGVLGAAAGMLLAPAVLLDPFMMLDPFLKGFAAAVLGGMDSLPGAVVGGLLLGVAESAFAGYVSVKYKATLSFVVIVAVLLARPEGLLGRPFHRRV